MSFFYNIYLIQDKGWNLQSRLILVIVEVRIEYPLNPRNKKYCSRNMPLSSYNISVVSLIDALGMTWQSNTKPLLTNFPLNNIQSRYFWRSKIHLLISQ